MTDSPAPDAAREWLSAHGYSDDRFVRTVLRAQAGLRLEPDAAAEAVSTLYLSFQGRAAEGRLPRFADENAFCSYLFTVARNYLRRVSRVPKGAWAGPLDVHEFSAADASERVRQSDRPDRGALAGEVGDERVLAVIGRLPDDPPPPPSLRRIAEHCYQGLTFTQIAERLCTSKATITRRVREAEEYVQVLLDELPAAAAGAVAASGGDP